MPSILTWVKYIAIFIVSVFFLAIGTSTLIGSFQLKNPVEFVMYFFSSSLLIMVCICGLIYLFFRIFVKKRLNETVDGEPD